MPLEEKIQLSQRAAQDKSQVYKNDLMSFLKELVYTLDENDKVNPIKRLPMDKGYLQDLTDIFKNERLLLIEKSRQMLITWTGMAYCLWTAMFYEGRRVVVQSKKEQDANYLVDRCKFIYERLPDWLKQMYPANPPAYCKLEFGKHNSIIQGIPQGAEQLRQYTVSLIWADEMAFQEKNEEAFIAAKPTLINGGQFIGVSSPNFKEFFFRCKSDII